MSNDKHNIMSDDEYQFPKDEYLDHSATASADTGAPLEDEVSDEKVVKKGGPSIFERFPILKNKKLYFAGAVVIIMIVGVRLMHHSSDNKVIMQHKPVATAQVQATPKVEQPTSQLMDQLDSIKSSQENSQDTITSLQSHISDLNNKLNSAASTNAQLSQSVTMLAAQVKLLSADVEKNTKKLTAKPKKVVKHHGPVYHPKPITYDVKAIVPGRAWIVSSTGRSYSVAVGDQVAQYGRVKAIDDESGHVYTTSGKVIAYGPNDS